MREEIRQEEIIDTWIRAWQNGKLGTDYSEARKFRDFWLKEYPGLGMIKALEKFNEKYNA